MAPLLQFCNSDPTVRSFTLFGFSPDQDSWACFVDNKHDPGKVGTSWNVEPECTHAACVGGTVIVATRFAPESIHASLGDDRHQHQPRNPEAGQMPQPIMKHVGFNPALLSLN